MCCATIADVGLAFDDGLVLDAARFELRRDGRTVPMEPQTFDVLTYLVSHRDRVVPKEELMDAVWGGRFVTEAAVTSRIKQARRALGDDGRGQRMIRTVHGRGYRFIAEVSVEAASGTEPRPEPGRRRRPTPHLRSSHSTPSIRANPIQVRDAHHRYECKPHCSNRPGTVSPENWTIRSQFR